MINVFYLIGAVLVVLVFFRVANTLSLRSRLTQKYIPALNAIELALWAILLFWTVYVFFGNKSYSALVFNLLLVLFIILLVWFYLKDVIAGFLFRMRHNPIKGQILQYDKLKGVIKTIGLSQLTVEAADGQLCRVPYSTIVTQTLSLHAQHSLAPGETIVKLKLQSTLDPNRFERSVRETLAMSSWCIASKPITIQPDLTEDGTMIISFFMIDPSYLSMAKTKLNNLAEKVSEVN